VGRELIIEIFRVPVSVKSNLRKIAVHLANVLGGLRCYLVTSGTKYKTNLMLLRLFCWSSFLYSAFVRELDFGLRNNGSAKRWSKIEAEKSFSVPSSTWV
jgi:hypothetical protein